MVGFYAEKLPCKRFLLWSTCDDCSFVQKKKSRKLSSLVFHVRSLFICGENEYQASVVLPIHTISVLIGS